jgi:hypothetical protein
LDVARELSDGPVEEAFAVATLSMPSALAIAEALPLSEAPAFAVAVPPFAVARAVDVPFSEEEVAVAVPLLDD